jgi:hypothetical protein
MFQVDPAFQRDGVVVMVVVWLVGGWDGPWGPPGAVIGPLRWVVGLALDPVVIGSGQPREEKRGRSLEVSGRC